MKDACPHQDLDCLKGMSAESNPKNEFCRPEKVCSKKFQVGSVKLMRPVLNKLCFPTCQVGVSSFLTKVICTPPHFLHFLRFLHFLHFLRFLTPHVLLFVLLLALGASFASLSSLWASMDLDYRRPWRAPRQSGHAWTRTESRK